MIGPMSALAFLFLLWGGGIPGGADFKCAPTTEGPLLWIDGEPVGRDLDEMRELDRDEIASVWVLCWDPLTETFTRDPTALGAVYLTTRSFHDGIIDDLRAIAGAQDRHRERTGTFARKAADLELDDLTPGLRISLEAEGDSWRANVTLDPVVQVCRVSERDPNPSCALHEDLERR